MTRFQIQGKKGVAFAINSNNLVVKPKGTEAGDLQSYSAFTAFDYEVL